MSAFGSWASGAGQLAPEPPCGEGYGRLAPYPLARARAAADPGFVDAHCHAFQRALRGRPRAQTSGRGARRCSSSRAAQTPERVRASYVGCLPRAARGRLHGGRRVPLPRARGGARGGRGGGARRGSSSSSSTSRTRAAGSSASGRSRWPRISRELEELRADGIRVGVAPHSVRACPRDWLEELGRYAAEHELPLHVHADEQPREIEECLAEHGLRPIELLDACGCLGPRTTVVHATHADGHELDLLAAAGARVCACPTTEADLGDGFLPVERVLHRGIELCIGSDSNVRIDPLEELRELDGIARRQSGRRDVFAVDDLLDDRLARRRGVRWGSTRGRRSPSTSTIRSCGRRGLAERARRVAARRT